MSAPSAPAKQAPPPPAKPTDSILLRHKRDAYYFSLTVFVCAYLLPLDEATAACAAGPTAGAQEFALQHGRWIATIVARNLAMCTIVYGGYHKIMYEGLGKIAIDATPGSKYNPKWPSQADVSREQLYSYLGWLQLSAYEAVFVYLWASGSLSYNKNFFADERTGELSAYVAAYHALHIVMVPYWRDFHFFFAHRLMHPWFDRKAGLLQGDIGAFM